MFSSACTCDFLFLSWSNSELLGCGGSQLPFMFLHFWKNMQQLRRHYRSLTVHECASVLRAEVQKCASKSFLYQKMQRTKLMFDTFKNDCLSFCQKKTTKNTHMSTLSHKPPKSVEVRRLPDVTCAHCCNLRCYRTLKTCQTDDWDAACHQKCPVCHFQ